MQNRCTFSVVSPSLNVELVKCESCKGTGWWMAPSYHNERVREECPACLGDGVVRGNRPLSCAVCRKSDCSDCSGFSGLRRRKLARVAECTTSHCAKHPCANPVDVGGGI